MLRLDAEHWIKAGLELADGRLWLSVVVTNGVSDWSQQPAPEPDADGWWTIRAVREGDAVQILCGAQPVRLAPLPGRASCSPARCAPHRRAPASSHGSRALIFRARLISRASPRAGSRSPSGAGNAPRVLVGTRLKTPIGVLEIDERRGRQARHEADARAAGYASAGECSPCSTARATSTGSRCTSPGRTRGSRCARHRPTPRCSPRSRAGRGPTSTCRRSPTSPELRAPDLAAQFGRETRAVQARRAQAQGARADDRLKIGYELSPRGQLTLSSRPNARRNTSP